MNVSVLVNDGNREYANGYFTKALKFYEKASLISRQCDLGDIYYNIGLCHLSLMDYQLSEKNFDISFNKYGNKNCGYELCMSLLFNGKLEEGMEMYKYRYFGHRAHFPNLPIPHVTDLDQCIGKKVLVLNEEGMGDEIMFSRFVPELAKRAITFDYQVYDKIFPLFEKNYSRYSNINLFTSKSISFEYVMGFDCWTSSGDMFASHIKTYGMQHIPFNTADTIDQVLSVGVTWFANVLSKSSERRSLDPNLFKDAIVGENTEVVSLQYGECLDWMCNPDISDFNKTFNVIEKLDLVITVDTVTAHLAGMMNKNTILVYDQYLDWRWVYKLYKNVQLVKITDLKMVMDVIRTNF